MRLPSLFYWTPRVLSVVFVLFLALFSLDVFSEYSGWSAVVPLLIHLIPVFVVAALVGVAWRYSIAGAIIFIGLAGLYVWMVGPDRPWSWYAGISGPALFIGLLFLIDKIYNRRPIRL